MCSIFHMMYAENSTSFLVLWGPQHLSRKHRSLTCFYLQCTKYDRISWEYCLPYLGSVFLLFRKIIQRQKTAHLLLNCMFFIDLLSLQQLAYQACVLTWIWHPRNCYRYCVLAGFSGWDLEVTVFWAAEYAPRVLPKRMSGSMLFVLVC